MGIHRWQYMMAPPTFRRGDDYYPGVWCIFCAKRHRTWVRPVG